MPPRKKKPPTYTDEQLVLFIATALASGASAQSIAGELTGPLGIPTKTIVMVLLIAMSNPNGLPGSPIEQSPTAAGQVQKLEPYFRSSFVLESSRRTGAALKAGRPRRDVLNQERTYFRQHLLASANRRKAAQAVDAAAGRYGSTLGWHATLDSRTSPECREANGKNFDATVRPAIGYPGSVHISCRCKPGKPFNTNKTVYSVEAKVA